MQEHFSFWNSQSSKFIIIVLLRQFVILILFLDNSRLILTRKWDLLCISYITTEKGMETGAFKWPWSESSPFFPLYKTLIGHNRITSYISESWK